MDLLNIYGTENFKPWLVNQHKSTDGNRTIKCKFEKKNNTDMCKKVL